MIGIASRDSFYGSPEGSGDHKVVDCNSFIHLTTILLSIHYGPGRVLDPWESHDNWDGCALLLLY